MQIGLEHCLDSPPRWLGEARFGLLMNQASVDHAGRYACDLLAARFPGRLRALFSPQHGLWGEQQANMDESPDDRYPPLQLDVFSLYSWTRRPTPEMLAELDGLVIDLQDVGTRVYTFVWTVLHCLEACAEAGIRVLVLDRPNPLGGDVVEGPCLDPSYTSFVGRAAIPMRHGLTLGELARWLNQEFALGADLEVVPMRGWRRDMLWPETRRVWVPPSPNMPRFETSAVYPGMVLLEGTNISEGRGTTMPFEWLGAPWIDPFALQDRLADFELPGMATIPIRFRPTFDKWHDARCGGVALRINDPRLVRSYQAGVTLLSAISELWPESFELLAPPYEYEFQHMPLDIISGSALLRRHLSAPAGRPAGLSALWDVDTAAWHEATAAQRLYD